MEAHGTCIHWRKKHWATETAEKGCFKLTKWAYLEKRSTTTKMQEKPPEEGNPSMKSIETTDQDLSSTGSSYSRLGSLDRSDLAC
jgi:hypothetical protein